MTLSQSKVISTTDWGRGHFLRSSRFKNSRHHLSHSRASGNLIKEYFVQEKDPRLREDDEFARMTNLRE